ncbi:MAG: response regulator [Proteobacteria bacterium]|nr:response regulator [Pseudomonadota bacterium]
MRKTTVLLVDDEESILRSVGANLRRYGYEVVIAHDGPEALQTLEETMPDLVVLDISLPGLDGFEVCRQVREWSQVPIIMLSGWSDPEDRVKLLRMGADDYLAKPFSVEELVARVEAVLRRVPQAHIVATDISGASVERLSSRLREYPNVEARVADITRLDFEDGVFDAAIGNSALHHVDTQLCLKELFRVLRPGGRLLIFEPNLLNPEVLFESTVARRLAVQSLEYSVEEQTHTRWRYRSMLRRAGFVQVSVRPFDFLHPKTPRFLLGAVVNVGRVLECFPILREISGSLLLAARRPA